MKRKRQDSNLRGQSPVNFGSTPLTAWVRLLLSKKAMLSRLVRGILPASGIMTLHTPHPMRTKHVALCLDVLVRGWVGWRFAV